MKTLAVLSCKGGTGKTTFAVNLAVAVVYEAQTSPYYGCGCYDIPLQPYAAPTATAATAAS